jgi:hypothetical protein
MPGTPIWPLEGQAIGTPVTGSLADDVAQLYNANYTQGRCYPTLAAGSTVVSGINWALSAAFAVLVPINTILVPYHVSAISIETCDKDGQFEIAIYQGVANTLMATARFSSVAGFILNSFLLIPSLRLPANTQLDMKAATSGGVAATITASIIYRFV